MMPMPIYGPPIPHTLKSAKLHGKEFNDQKRKKEKKNIEIARPYSFKLTLLKSEEHKLEMGKGI